MTTPANPIQATPPQVCATLIDLFTRDPLKLNMQTWESEPAECETMACVAGWTGLLHGDSAGAMVPDFDENPKEEQRWRQRQADRLGITKAASEVLFLETTESQVVPMLGRVIEWHDLAGKLAGKLGVKVPKQTMRRWLNELNGTAQWRFNQRYWRDLREKAIATKQQGEA